MSLFPSSVRPWLPLVGLTLSAFIFNTSEFVPIGILTDIASDLGITEAHAGWLISVYAWAVALLSLPLMLLVSRMEFRRLLMLTFGVFILSHVGSALASGFVTLMLSRLGVACSHAVFWSIATPLAVRIAPEGRRAVALSMIVTGTAVALIAGLPLGRIVGLHLGWRMTFLSVGLAAAAVLVLLAVVFPRVPVRNRVSLRNLPPLLRSRPLVGIYLLTLVAVTGHYTAYSYIEPFLKQAAGMPDGLITFTLVAFGAAGLLSSFAFSRYFDRHPRPFVCLGATTVALLLLLLQLSSLSVVTAVALCVLWGVAITAFNLVFNAEVIRFAPTAAPIAMSIFSGIYNVGIGGGALVGGLVCTYSRMDYIGYVGGGIGVVAALYLLLRLRRLMQY